MIRICFICLGNICRSPMAEFIMKDKLKKLGLEEKFQISSIATSYEEEGNDIYPPVKEILTKMHIPYTKHCATRLEESDKEKYDMFICMEDSNIIRTISILNDYSKVSKLLERDISDPWYTGDFVTTYNDIVEGINILLDKLINKVV